MKKSKTIIIILFILGLVTMITINEYKLSTSSMKYICVDKMLYGFIKKVAFHHYKKQSK